MVVSSTGNRTTSSPHSVSPIQAITYEPTPHFQAKVFKVRGFKSDKLYTVEVSDECIYVVETKTVYKYCDNQHLTFGGIVRELQGLLV